ncbi:hypothetical protein ACJJIG_02035 [Microbulbifer sp. SSSA007]|uniref:hypothetical protein n=1 Tax=Microbulbifer TaxID=48073 RepID=UPI0012F937CA|nr:hypothetical protein [Microbulbifer variabilis]
MTEARHCAFSQGGRFDQPGSRGENEEYWWATFLHRAGALPVVIVTVHRPACQPVREVQE